MKGETCFWIFIRIENISLPLCMLLSLWALSYSSMLIIIIYKSAFNMMKVHKLTCLFIPSKITLITITDLPNFHLGWLKWLVFFLNKGFLWYNRLTKTVSWLLFTFVYEVNANGNKLFPLNADVSTLVLWIGNDFYFRYMYICICPQVF